MEINKYPDGSSYIDVKGENFYNFIFKINTYEDLWHLNQVVDAANNNDVTPTIVIPNLIDAQADRRFSSKQSSGLKLVCKFLNGMNANFKIFHPHNPEVVEALMDNVSIIDNYYFIDSILESFDKFWQTNHKGSKKIQDSLILMSSDAGGFKPMMKLCDRLNWKGDVYSASKARSWNKDGETKLVQQIDREDFCGKDVLIIDDISVYGGTFKGLSKLLKERNCGKLYLAVSHMTVQNLNTDPVTNYFDKVFTTNSKFETYNAGLLGKHMSPVQPKNLEIIKLF